MELYRSRCIELVFDLHSWLAFELGNHYDERDILHISLLGFSAFITIPKILPYKECWEGGWGFSITDQDIFLHVGRKVIIFHWFWRNWQHIRHSILLIDNTWWNEPHWSYALGLITGAPRPVEPDNKFKETKPFHYILKSGTVQTADATYTVEEREWRLRYLTWLPIKKVSRCIAVEFSEEMGEERGSWKGGVLGASHEMKYYKERRQWEKPSATLVRMMKESRFGR